MNIDELERKLNKISSDSIQYEEELKNISKNISEKDKTKQSREEYYNMLSETDREYQQNNDIYKDWVGNYSKAYIEMSDFYVGEELPREHYLQSKKDIIELYKLFMFYGMLEQYMKFTTN